MPNGKPVIIPILIRWDELFAIEKKVFFIQHCGKLSQKQTESTFAIVHLMPWNEYAYLDAGQIK